MSSVIYIGMDVHKDSFSLCALDSDNNQIVLEAKCAAEIKFVEKFTKRVSQLLKKDISFVLGYEAGIWGYSLYHQLVDAGYYCVILAPSTMSSSPQHKLRKNDHLDAQMIANNLNSNSYKKVYVPDEEDDAVKEFIRLIRTFKKELKQTKQRIKSFVLRNGFRYDSHHASWTKRYFDWLNQLKLSEIKRMALNEYIIHYEELIDKLERLNGQLESIAHQDRYQDPVAALCCFRGIKTTAAMTIQVETADFSRFPNAKAYGAYLGMIPSDHSSGPRNRLGQITKQGNSTIRTTLVECTQSLVNSNVYRKSKALKARQKGQSSQVIAYADRAAKRLKQRYLHLIRRGKSRNVAIMATAREFACFIWGMENQNYA